MLLVPVWAAASPGAQTLTPWAGGYASGARPPGARLAHPLVPWSPQLEVRPEASQNCPLQVPVLRLAALEALVKLEEG